VRGLLTQRADLFVQGRTLESMNVEADQCEMTLSPEILKALCDTLQKEHGFATVSQLDAAVLDILAKTQQRQQQGKNTFSLSAMIRGMRALRGESLNAQTQSADCEVLKALTTGSSPGSYLVPTIQAAEIIQFLETGGIARSAGVRIWPMAGIQKLNIPTALGAPTWVWMAQNSVQTPTDPNLGQVSFDLKERRALIAIPNQLLQTSVPAFDVLLAELLGVSAAAHEDTALFATTTVSGGPTALMSAANITVINAGGNSANGGNLAYGDILAVLAKAAANKARGPFVWFASPRTFYSRLMGMVDSSSRPIYLPTLSQGLFQGPIVGSTIQPVGQLMGYPVYITPYILENEAVSSGTNQSHLIFTNPTYIHIGQDDGIEIAVSLERYFDAAQTAVRGIQHEDFGFAPPAGITVLAGIN
jgi:HK97 family phage major capsid protein